ncbi:hypothetical protein Q4543_24220 [Salipiger sp. 1_MG-2023]|uniref:hypothetical protein n=1 Tax=Salipiger sp. 1_MG-2023 TaxID=3062665 RepID=UPI0026E42225|nr:hypothetical protein [Salipiger sp. 1_MG-2023]MDO6588558.1 hypothetical protein [Salipiger sp. 1_MG-2023]
MTLHSSYTSASDPEKAPLGNDANVAHAGRYPVLRHIELMGTQSFMGGCVGLPTEE